LNGLNAVDQYKNREQPERAARVKIGEPIRKSSRRYQNRRAQLPIEAEPSLLLVEPTGIEPVTSTMPL
jgi:hypothetical protein